MRCRGLKDRGTWLKQNSCGTRVKFTGVVAASLIGSHFRALGWPVGLAPLNVIFCIKILPGRTGASRCIAAADVKGDSGAESTLALCTLTSSHSSLLFLVALNGKNLHRRQTPILCTYIHRHRE